MYYISQVRSRVWMPCCTLNVKLNTSSHRRSSQVFSLLFSRGSLFGSITGKRYQLPSLYVSAVKEVQYQSLSLSTQLPAPSSTAHSARADAVIWPAAAAYCKKPGVKMGNQGSVGWKLRSLSSAVTIRTVHWISICGIIWIACQRDQKLDAGFYARASVTRSQDLHLS